MQSCSNSEHFKRKQAIKMLEEWLVEIEEQIMLQQKEIKEENEEQSVNKYPEILTVNEICEILQISKPTAYELMEQSDFPLLRIGRSKRVAKGLFFKWLNNKQKSNNLSS
jgi:excisionase family DNA binding protein